MTLFFARHAGAAAERPALYAEVLEESAQRPVLINALRWNRNSAPPAAVDCPQPGPPDARRSLVADRAEDLLDRRRGPALDGGLGPYRTSRYAVGPFLVRSGCAGASPSSRTWDHLGLRASRSDDVILDAVAVPGDAVIDLVQPGTGAGRLTRC